MTTRISFLVLLLACFVASPCLGQSLEVEKATDLDFVRLLNGIELVHEVESGGLRIRAFIIANLTGSADGESGEVTHSLLVAVSEFDELPDQAAFIIGGLYNPAIARIEDGGAGFTLAVGDMSDRRHFFISPSLAGLLISPVSSFVQNGAEP